MVEALLLKTWKMCSLKLAFLWYLHLSTMSEWDSSFSDLNTFSSPSSCVQLLFIGPGLDFSVDVHTCSL